MYVPDYFRARRSNCIGLSLLARFRFSLGMFSGRCAPENAPGNRLVLKRPAKKAVLVHPEVGVFLFFE
jgi:hypothetical protein